MSRRCPETGGQCFDLGCAAGCQGYDVHIEAITVVRTTIRRRAAVSLVYGASTSAGRATHDSSRTCDGNATCTCAGCETRRADLLQLLAHG